MTHQSSSDADTLALATRKGVREAPQVLDIELALGGHFAHSVIDLRAAPDQPHGLERFGNDVAYGHPWIERGVGILKDKLHVAAELSQLTTLQVRQIDFVTV